VRCHALPILHKDGVMQLIMIEDSADCANFGVHLSDQAATMQKMWSQMMGRLPPEAAPQCKRGLNMALCSFLDSFNQLLDCHLDLTFRYNKELWITCMTKSRRSKAMPFPFHRTGPV
jgi:hypothetical protein